MLHITIVAVGKLGERHWAEACDEYLKRLAGFCRPSVVEVQEARLSASPGEAEIAKAVAQEGDAILLRLPARAHVVALCIEGRQCSSTQWAQTLERLSGETSHVALVIGGSHGLSASVKETAHAMLSMSPMTFPHQLARVMLLEQLYRAFTITGGRKYHK